MSARDSTNSPVRTALIWAGCAAVAVALAVAAPHETSLVGQMPSLAAHTVDQRAVQLPRELPAERTLALLMFSPQQREEARTWIRGMRLRETPGVAWVKLEVGAQPQAQAPGTHPSSRLLQISADRNSVVQSLRLRSDDRVHALVLDREGNVLARAEGPWDEDKGQAILLALLAP